ncbi:MAG: PQQ-binding-like beta-propeller repeat protein, partial [Gammaproteobacteria bacterium]|nr:PQQ-binding-like beta-propeller repeat protein [Gammaproteobacteria bacterium]
MKRASRSSGVAVASVFLVLCVAAHAEVPQAPGTPSVLEHHANPTRSGLYVAPGLTLEAAAQLHADPQFHADLSGPVYAQPLYWAAPGADRGLLLVATEQNLVYALDSRTGALAWRTPLGPPVPRSALPCGNIDPLGVTGTPVIDAHSQALYLDAMIRDQVSGEPRHWIFALSLKDGSVLPGWPVDVEAALKAAGHKFVSAIQNQRSALTVIG